MPPPVPVTFPIAVTRLDRAQIIRIRFYNIMQRTFEIRRCERDAIQHVRTGSRHFELFHDLANRGFIGYGNVLAINIVCKIYVYYHFYSPLFFYDELC